MRRRVACVEADLGVGKHGEKGVDHADAGAENRYQTNNVAGFVTGGVYKRSGNSLGLQAEVNRCFVAN